VLQRDFLRTILIFCSRPSALLVESVDNSTGRAFEVASRAYALSPIDDERLAAINLEDSCWAENRGMFRDGLRFDVSNSLSSIREVS
jgi:hypothetical protein